MNRIRWQVVFRNAADWSSIAFLVLLIIVPVGTFIWLFFFTKTFAVTSITIVDAKQNTQSAVRDIAQQSIGNNILFTQTGLLEQNITQHVTQVKDAHIIRKLPGTLKIIIQERTPAILLLSGGTYYFVDNQGVAYEEAPLDALPGVVLPVVKNSDNNAHVTIGTRAVDDQFISFLHDALTGLPTITHSQVVEVQIPALATREAHFLLDKNWIVLMDTTRPAAGQLDVLSRLLEHTITGQDLEMLQYVDLRIPNRVYYKSRNSTL